MEALDTLLSRANPLCRARTFRLAHLKALGVSEAHNFQRFVSQQIHYTLHAREAEYELVPITLDQGLGILVWSPIAGGLLSGKFRRDKPVPEGTRHTGGHAEPPVYDWEKLYDIIEVIMAVAGQHKVGAQSPCRLLQRRALPRSSSAASTKETSVHLARATSAPRRPGSKLERSRDDPDDPTGTRTGQSSTGLAPGPLPQGFSPQTLEPFNLGLELEFRALSESTL